MRVRFVGGVRDGMVEDWPEERCKPLLRVNDLTVVPVRRPDKRFKDGYRLVDRLLVVSGEFVREDDGDGYRYVFRIDGGEERS